MPVYNGEEYVNAALDSILAQTFTDFELIITDNASTDGTAAICRAYQARDARIRYYRNNTNLGAAKNFNRCFELCTGEYFKWVAHDDVLAPSYLERCVEMLEGSPPDVVLCFPRRRLIAPEGRALGDAPGGKRSGRGVARSFDRMTFSQLLRVPDSVFPTFVFGLMRASAAARTRLIGGYIASDLVFVAEMRLLGEFREVPEELYFQRLHAATPDVLERMTRSGDAAWFDPSRRRAVIMPEWRLLSEYLRAVRRSDGSVITKAKRYGAVAAQIPVRLARRVARIGPRMQTGLWACWSRLSLATVRHSTRTLLPLRLWVFLAGIRRRSSRHVGLAFSRSTPQTESALLSFAAERLMGRGDLQADRLLADWLMDSDRTRRDAAARVMGPHPERFGPLVRDSIQRRRLVQVEPVVRSLSQHAGAECTKAWDGVFASGSGVSC